MSDWRSGNNKDGNGRKESRPKPNPLPSAKPNANDSSSVTQGPSADWRGNAKKRTVASKPQDRTWTGRDREKTASTSGLRKALLLSGLGLAIAILFYSYWAFIFNHDPKLPIVVSIAPDYATLDLGPNSFGTQAFDLPQEKLHLMHASQKVANGEPLKLIADEQFLNEIKTNDDWGRKWRDFEKYRKGTFLKGGGPSKSVTAYFISCLIARASAPEIGAVSNFGESSNPWVLLTKDDDPYNGSNGKFTISLLLERIASQTADGSYAFVVMDVKTPIVVSNLGDLEFPHEAFDKAFKGLEPKLQKRLVVCLPCDVGQESWIAPEFSSSVFSHFFWKGVTTGFNNSKNKWSILEFQNSLKDQVSNWVARYRYAKQTPTFLMDPETERRIKDVLFVETSGGEFNMQSGVNLKSVLKARYRTLEKLWDDYSTLEHCLHTNPLRHATMESGLIQMEDIAEYASESAWNEFESRIQELIKKLKDLAKFDRRVSLVEFGMHSKFFGGPSVFIEPADAHCLKVWEELEKAAMSNDKETWTKKFNNAALLTTIKAYELDPNRVQFEWIEVRLLKLIHEAISDNDAKPPKAVEAIAGLFTMYSNLNTIAFEPRLELSKWTEKKVIALDKLFSECFDHFFANDFDACVEKLKPMQWDYKALSEEFNKLKQAMKTRDEVFRLAPHLLASQMRMSRHVDDAKSLFASDIASLLHDAFDIRDSMVDDLATVGNLSLKPEAESKLKGLTSRLNEAFEKIASNAETDPGTIPMRRIALRWPLIPKELRSKLHDQLVNLYEAKKEDGQNSDATKSERSSLTPSSVGSEFLSKLHKVGSNLEVNEGYYERLVRNDPRYSILKVDADTDSNPDSTSVKQRIYRKSYETRMLASSFGQRATTHRTERLLLSWPWNSPDQLQAVNEALYNHVQAERLFITRWGDGDLDAPTVEGLYFERMLAERGSVSKSFNTSPLLVLKDFEQARSISKELENSYSEILKKAQDEVKRLRIVASSFGTNVGENDSAPVSLTLTPNDWDAFATVSVHEDRKPDRIHFSNFDKSKKSIGFQLKNGELIPTLKLDPRLIGKQLRLSVRGHYRKIPLIIADPGKTFHITMDRPIEPAKVRVKANNDDPITLWVLLDCSGSMEHKEIHSQAKSTASRLLERVMKLKENIHVGFIAFGRKPDSNIPTILKKSSIGEQIFKSALKKEDEITELIELVESPWIKPSGCTPLYDAIYTACSESKKDGRNWIVVISDGSNDLDLYDPSFPPDDPLGKNYPIYYYHKNGNKSVHEIEKEVLNSKSSLVVYQFSNDAFYREKKDENGKLIFDKARIDKVAAANRELQTLMENISPKNAVAMKSELFYSSFETLERDLIGSLPVSTISIESQGKTLSQGKFSEDIPVNLIKSTKAKVWVNRGEKKLDEFSISLSGGEKLEFKYSDIRGLTVIPYKDDPNFGNSVKMTTDGVSKSNVYVKASPALSAPYRLDIQLSLRGDVVGTVEQKTFTHRPSFVVAAIRPKDTSLNKAFWVSDHKFRRETHYPIVQLPDFPWQQDNQWRSEEVDMEVWMSDEVPSGAVKVSLKPGDPPKEEMESKFRCVRTNNQVTVSIPSAITGRYFVMCNLATKTDREYLADRETKVVFDVPNDQTAEISIFKLSELQTWAADGTLQHFLCPELKFLKN